MQARPRGMEGAMGLCVRGTSWLEGVCEFGPCVSSVSLSEI